MHYASFHGEYCCKFLGQVPGNYAGTFRYIFKCQDQFICTYSDNDEAWGFNKKDLLSYLNSADLRGNSRKTMTYNTIMDMITLYV